MQTVKKQPIGRLKPIRIAISLLITAAAFVGIGHAEAADRPNVVLIVADDQAAGDFAFMGHPIVKTPNLDRLAAGSICFRRGYVTSSLCCPSLASILTGRFPHETGIANNDPPVPDGMTPADFRRSEVYLTARSQMNRLMEQSPTLPRILAANGYSCLQTGKWWWGSYSTGGFTHGMSHGDPDRGGRHGDIGLDIGRKTMKPIVDFVRDAKSMNRPFFVWYAPMMPHQPHNPPERLLTKYRDKTPSIHVARYWAMIEWFDGTCGQLLDFLDAERLRENTVVVFLTDNGWIQNPNEAKPMRSKLTQYDAGHRTPILVSWPGKLKPSVSETPVSSIDILPTLLAATGCKPPGNLRGIDLADSTAVQNRTAIFGECFTHNAVNIQKPAASLRFRWIVEGNWRLVVPSTNLQPIESTQLFDLAKDPAESNDVSLKHPEVVKKMDERLNEWWNGKN